MSDKQFRSMIVLGLLPALALVAYQSLWSQEKEKKELRREELLQAMRGLAQEAKVKLVTGEQQAELVTNPVFRYDDQPRRFIDATIWAWTHEGRPVAFQKIEALDPGPATAIPTWQYCFASMSTDRLAVEWTPNRRFRSTEPGIVFRPLADSPPVVEGNTQRKRQAREIMRKFSASIFIDPKDVSDQQMRFLTTPLFEYADPQTKVFRGAVFGFSTNGTNPDLLVLLEARGDKARSIWHAGPARMTSGAVTLRYQESEIWKVDHVDPSQAPFPTWTFFTTPRTTSPSGDDS
jgi:hypothetical protein